MSTSIPRSLLIFFLDGTPNGIRTAQMQMSTILAVAFKREQFAKIKQRSETMFEKLNETGIYILVGQDEEGQKIGYIGETHNVIERINRHFRDDSKSFWSEAVVVVNKDDLLTKAHVLQIERQLLEVALKNPDWKMDNDRLNKETTGGLPPHDIAFCDEFSRQTKMLVAGLGYDLFRSSVKSGFASDVSNAQEEDISQSSAPVFYGKHKGVIIARMKIDEVNGQYVVLKGSKSRVKNPTSNAVPKETVAAMNNLKNNGVIDEVSDPDYFIFKEDVPFSSSSAAAQIIAASSYSGPKYWKTENNVTLENYLLDIE